MYLKSPETAKKFLRKFTEEESGELIDNFLLTKAQFVLKIRFCKIQ